MITSIKLVFRAFLFFALSGILIIFSSCTDGVDFDRTDEIILTPEVEASLIFFDLDSEIFSSVDDDDDELIFTDITPLEFLDDTPTQENLIEVEIEVLISHTINKDFINTSRFLDRQGNLQYEFSFDVPASEDGALTTVSFTEVISQGDIQAIRNSILYENQLQIQLDGTSLLGELNLQSKAIYRFIFDEL